jgi:hypothetical protein
MKNKILILSAIAALASSALASAVCNPFTPNTVLTAAALNNAIGSPCINSGVINVTPIGSITPSTGAFTTLSASGTVSGVGFNNYLASPPAIGATTPAAGAFTTLSATGAVSGVGFSNYLASPPPIGATTPAAGAFTTLSATGAVSGVGFNNYLASPPPIGGTTPAAGAFTTLSATGTISLASINATPIGGTTPAAGAFTTLSATGAVTVPNATLATQAVALGQVLPLSSMTSSRVTTTVAQAIAANTWTQIQFNTVGYDDLTEFNTTTHQWTVKAAGTYFVSAAIEGAQTTVTNRFISAYVNGVLTAGLQQSISNPGSAIIAGATQLRLALGDVVAIYYLSGLADTLFANSAYTYATLERVK